MLDTVPFSHTDDGTDSSAVLLDTHTWAVVRQWPLPSQLADLLWISSELGVFSETLSPAVKVSLCVCAVRQLPQIVQVRFECVKRVREREMQTQYASCLK